MGELAAGFFAVGFVVWLVMGVAAAAFLSRHDRVLTGFAWGFLFGPLGVLMAFLKAENIDRENSDRETRELLRGAITTRERDATRAMVAALAQHLAHEQLQAAPTAPPAAPPSLVAPKPRSYEEIMAAEPQRPPRRFR